MNEVFLLCALVSACVASTVVPAYVILYNDGTRAASVGEYAYAITLFDNALRLAAADPLSDRSYYLSKCPRSKILLNNKGYVLYCLGKYEEALAMYDAAIKTDRRYNKALYNKGDTLMKLNRLPEAQAAYEAAYEAAQAQDTTTAEEAPSGLEQTQQNFPQDTGENGLGAVGVGDVVMLLVPAVIVVGVGLVVYRLIKRRSRTGVAV
ncbi:hypothetical protein Pelo_9746 [Pelomyxa schiedti]|nr:hypothetical protein Pelo_9746 [Pelomyxa schiedti]